MFSRFSISLFISLLVMHSAVMAQPYRVGVALNNARIAHAELLGIEIVMQQKSGYRTWATGRFSSNFEKNYTNFGTAPVSFYQVQTGGALNLSKERKTFHFFGEAGLSFLLDKNRTLSDLYYFYNNKPKRTPMFSGVYTRIDARCRLFNDIAITGGLGMNLYFFGIATGRFTSFDARLGLSYGFVE